MFNISRDLPNSRAERGRTSEDYEVAASVREYFGKNVTRLLTELRAKGVLQKDIAERLELHTTQLSHWKAGNVPEADTLQAFIDLVNEFGVPCEPEDLFINPLKALARREGYRLVKDT